jgi:4-amino-4-deoxy-L-arabinose transferase-like glycosyltransferase
MKTSQGPQSELKISVGVLLLVVIVAWLANLELRGLFIPDEGRYAEIAREMLASGDWITPRLNDLKYFEKPPLQYWLTAISYIAFGEDEWTARLPPAILGICSIAMVGYTARRIWNSRAELFAIIVLSSNWAFYLSGQYLTLDMTLSALLGIAMCCFLIAQSGTPIASLKYKWMLFAWTGIGFAFLSKGLIAFVIPGITLVVYSFWTRSVRIWKELSLVSGTIVVLLISMPWLILVQVRNPEFFQFFFVHEQFQRFSTDVHSRTGAWWYYVPILFVGFLPWTPALVHYLRDFCKASLQISTRRTTEFEAERFCLSWVLAILVFFSMSHSKLPGYIIPAFPALALLLGKHFHRSTSTAFRWCAWTAGATGALVLFGMTRLDHWEKFVNMTHGSTSGLSWLYGAAVTMLTSGIAAVLLVRRSATDFATGVLAIGSFVFWTMAFAFMYEQDVHFSSERIAEKITKDTKPYYPSLPFYSVGQFDHSLPFYLGRTMTLVDVVGELAPGIKVEPNKIISTINEFITVWNALNSQGFAVMTHKQFLEFTEIGLPMFVQEQDDRLVIVSRNALIKSGQ